MVILAVPFSSSTAGGDDGNRTHDPLLAGQVLSQLSYTPIGLGLFSVPYRLLKIEQQADLCFLCCTVRFLLVVFPLWFVFAYLQIRDICE